MRLVPSIATVMLVTSCVTSPSESSGSPTRSIDAYLAQLENDDSSSGVVMVAKDFVPFATKATGYADRARGAPNATITPFNIASITRVFTAVAIGELVDQGKIALEDPLTKYLPTYPHTPGDRITIAMLLSQTAGTGNYRDDPGYLRVRDSFESVSELLGAVNTAVTPGAVPGKTFSFSDTGYLLLGAVIEKASGRDYYDYMDNEVFASNDDGASAVFAMTPTGYTVIVLANVGSVATPVGDKILKLVGS